MPMEIAPETAWGLVISMSSIPTRPSADPNPVPKSKRTLWMSVRSRPLPSVAKASMGMRTTENSFCHPAPGPKPIF